MFYKQQIIETVSKQATYYVEADSPEEALEQIALGETVREEYSGKEEVLSRDSFAGIEECDEEEQEELKQGQ